jgi:hypothetical protein
MARVKENQVTIVFDGERLAEIEAIAAREERSLAAQVRYLVSRALDQRRDSPPAAAA